jgi:hypothetical protein
MEFTQSRHFDFVGDEVTSLNLHQKPPIGGEKQASSPVFAPSATTRQASAPTVFYTGFKRETEQRLIAARFCAKESS